MENNIEIFITDLTEEKRQEVINVLGDDGNYDIVPIAVIPIPIDD